MELTLDEKKNIYFSRYRTGGFFSLEEYLNIRQEERIFGLFKNKKNKKNKKDIKCK